MSSSITFCNEFDDAVRAKVIGQQRRMLGCLLDDELEGVWKETGVA
jgi:hypothetical protein